MVLDWSTEKIKAFRRALLDWYDQEKRDLPWRRDHDPYHVLLSETMLQQTQVATVIPYYEHFLQLFPTVAALAKAPEAQVMKAWEGLGYYSRARHLQLAAKQVVLDFGGLFPETAAELRTLAGIGPYTAGAIASIAFNQPEPAIDGNAFRVFARLLKIDADITRPQTRQVFDDLIRQLIDPQRPGDFNQAIMDLGSSYMRAKDPDPAHSPLAAFDQSYLSDTVLDYPVKSKKKPPVVIPYFALVVHSPQGYLLMQRPRTGMLGDLWMFPLVDRSALPAASLTAQLTEAAAQFAAETGVQLPFTDAGKPLVKHTFTHQQWQLTLIEAASPAFDLAVLPARWVAEADLATVALPTVQKKLFKALAVGGMK
ncbi:A/G-specific adenine glycosylase [Lacticaseibacillus jixianensis]|uniref:Adenine DNA glycosylase n=1 Tax=Lacticaseibacillus jixianensis TaxID=2486012 RepID=A0ABW4B683_9LACO|nr:A/G-specific adenine glycosylase [Lacticaseibacillus jixianensis]